MLGGPRSGSNKFPHLPGPHCGRCNLPPMGMTALRCSVPHLCPGDLLCDLLELCREQNFPLLQVWTVCAEGLLLPAWCLHAWVRWADFCSPETGTVQAAGASCVASAQTVQLGISWLSPHYTPKWQLCGAGVCQGVCSFCCVMGTVPGGVWCRERKGLLFLAHRPLCARRCMC